MMSKTRISQAHDGKNGRIGRRWIARVGTGRPLRVCYGEQTLAKNDCGRAAERDISIYTYTYEAEELENECIRRWQVSPYSTCFLLKHKPISILASYGSKWK